MKRLVVFPTAVLFGLLYAQAPEPQFDTRLDPRAKATDYTASQPLSKESQVLAAESLAHSIPISRGGVLFAENHIVIETAFYGPPRSAVTIAPEHFTLVVNRKKPDLLPDTPGAVAGSMRDSIFSSGPSLQASGSVGDAGVILGRRRPQTGIPDIDVQPPGQRNPLPPRAPGPADRSGTSQQQQPLNVREEIERASILRGEFRLPYAGLLYFPYRGKLKSIKSMVLRYQPPGQEPVELTLVP